MTINGINGANTQMGQMGMNQAADSYSRNIQNQITKAQKQLQELSSNEGMTLEEKMKKRQEIQQQISDLNVQLRQHQMEQRRAAMGSSEKQQTKNSSMDDMPGGTGSAGNTKSGNRNTGLSQASMTAMLSADSSIKQAKVQGSVATKMEGRSGILQSEIKLDQARGGDTQKKEEELAETEQKAQAAASSQLSTLADADKKMEEAAQADSRDEKDAKNDKDAKKDKNVKNDKQAKYVNSKHTDGNVSGTAVQGGSVNTQPDVSVSNSAAAAGTKPQRPMDYVPVDIRL